MRYLCHARFLSNVASPSVEFFNHVGTVWSCVEDSTLNQVKNTNFDPARNRQFPKSVVFITDCQSVEQLTSGLERMPGVGLSDIEVFPLQ